MATVSSLFGSGLSEQELASQLLDKKATDFAQLSQGQRLAQMGYTAGNQVGTGLAGAFGVDVQDPMVKRATMLRQMAQQFDTTSPTGLRQLAQAMQSVDPDMALKVAQQAAAMEKASADVRLTDSTITKNMREGLTPEQKNAAALADSAFDRGTPEWNKTYAAELSKLTAKDKTQWDISTVGIDSKTKEPVYTLREPGKAPKQVKQAIVNGQETWVPFSGAVDRTTAKTDLSGLGDVMSQAFAKAEGGKKAETWQTAGEAAKLQTQLLPKLEEVERNLPKTFTGAFADTALQFGKAIEALGVPIDQTKLTNTEYLNSVSSQLLQTIAKNFPGSLAVKEMEQLIKSKPNSQQQVKTISRILSDLRTEMQSNIITYEKLAKLPEKERYSKDYTSEQNKNFRDISRYHALERKAMEATSQKPMTKQEVEEAKTLKQQLGL